MDKKKALSKEKIYKQKISPNKTKLDFVSSESSKNGKNTDLLKKSATPTPSRSQKSKITLSKRVIDNPITKLENFDTKRKSVVNTQESLESYYSSYIKTLTTKLNKHKTRNAEIEEELKQMEISFNLEQTTLKKDLEKSNFELKKLRKEKTEHENVIMEENFLIRKEFEEYKSVIGELLTDIRAFLENPGETEEGCDKESILNRIRAANNIPNTIHYRLSLRETASFNENEVEISSPIAESNSVHREAIVMHPYEPKYPDEIQLKVGDRVLILSSIEINGFWIGKVEEKIGKFPCNCVMLD